MDRKFNCESEHERDKEAKARAADIRRKFDESIWCEEILLIICLVSES